MFVLLDTNILFSALLFDGNERRLIEKAIAARHQIVITDVVLAEIQEVIKRKVDRTRGEKIRTMMQRLRSSPFVYYKTQQEYKPFLPKAITLIHPKDAPILAAGLQPEIDAIVSGDADFLRNPKLKKKKIYTTKELLSVL